MLTESLPLYKSQALLPPLTLVFGINQTIPALLASPQTAGKQNSTFIFLIGASLFFVQLLGSFCSFFLS